MSEASLAGVSAVKRLGVWGAILWHCKEWSPTLHAVQGVAYNYQPNGKRRKDIQSGSFWNGKDGKRFQKPGKSLDDRGIFSYNRYHENGEDSVRSMPGGPAA